MKNDMNALARISVFSGLTACAFACAAADFNPQPDPPGKPASHSNASSPRTIVDPNVKGGVIDPNVKGIVDPNEKNGIIDPNEKSKGGKLQK